MVIHSDSDGAVTENAYSPLCSTNCNYPRQHIFIIRKNKYRTIEISNYCYEICHY